MNATSPSLPVGPTPEQFDELFPYHVVFDSSGAIRQVGKSLRQLCPEMVPSACIDDHFLVERPILVHWGEAIQFHLKDLFILKHRDRDLRLRGQILGFGPSLIAFAGSPWITDLGVAREYGIQIENLAIQAQKNTATDRLEEEERIRLQQEISTVLAESDAIETGMQQALSGFAKTLGASEAGCWAAENNCLDPQCLAFWSATPTTDLSVATEDFFAKARAIGLCVITRNDPSLHRSPACKTRFLVIPCRAAGRIVAAVLLAAPELAEPADDMLKLLAVLGNLVGQFIVRTQTRKALEQSRNFALQVMSLMGQGLTVSDENGRLTFANHAFASMVGLSPVELIGRSPGEFSVPTDKVNLEKMWEDRRSGLRSTYELMLVSANGDRIPVLISGVPRMENGTFSGTIAVITDLSEQKKVQEQMASALERERELNRLKSAFVTMASHEFRTPLASITYATEMLANFVRFLPEDRAPKGQRYVGIVLESAQRMGELMDGLLLLGRIESGRLSCSPIPVELAAFAEDLRREVRENSDRIQLDLPSDLPHSAVFDPSLLKHSLVNLLSNALKYSPPESQVRFAIVASSPGLNPAELSFVIQDRGCGIPIEDQQQIFQPFFRARNVGKIRGTGIGLTIARDCARLHGGELSFKSEPNQGTTFTVRIPLSSNPAAAR